MSIIAKTVSNHGLHAALKEFTLSQSGAQVDLEALSTDDDYGTAVASDTEPGAAKSTPSFSFSDSKCLKNLLVIFRMIGNRHFDPEPFPAIDHAYHMYTTFMKEAGLVDMRMIVSQFLGDFDEYRSLPSLRNMTHLLVDELQDLDDQQLELCERLIGMGVYVTAVGDFNQSIYNWRFTPERGPADSNTLKRARLIHSGERLMRTMKKDSYSEYVFKLNHRSDAAITRVSNKLVGITNDQHDASRSNGQACFLLGRSDEESLVRLCKLLKMIPQEKLHETAILVRFNSDKERIMHRLRDCGISFHSRTSRSPRSFPKTSKSLDNLLWILRCIEDPHDVVAHMIGMLSCSITQRNVELRDQILCLIPGIEQSIAQSSPITHVRPLYRVEEVQQDSLETLKAAVEKIDTRSLTGIRVRSVVLSFVANIRKVKTANAMTIPKCINAIISAFKIRSAKDVSEFIESSSNAASITDAIDKLRTNPNAGESNGGVYVGTIHSAKGREWSTVFMPFVNEGTLPSSKVFDVDEERRVMYVGMTRAKHSLVLLCTDGAGTMPSRFINESAMSPLIRFDDLVANIIHS
jgi:superfamily I DNA/RNA helicase